MRVVSVKLHPKSFTKFKLTIYFKVMLTTFWLVTLQTLDTRTYLHEAFIQFEQQTCLK